MHWQVEKTWKMTSSEHDKLRSGGVAESHNTIIFIVRSDTGENFILESEIQKIRIVKSDNKDILIAISDNKEIAICEMKQ